MKNNFLTALFVACLSYAEPVSGQGFAGLGDSADGFAIPHPNPVFRFPADHAAHPAFRIEWWYLTANLETDTGTPMGAQWTLFRSALSPDAGEGWQSNQAWMGHVALTTPQEHFSAEKLARGGIGQAGAVATPHFEAWIDDWTMKGQDSGLGQLKVSAKTDSFTYALELNADGPLILHGADGYSVKSQTGQASYYYSQPGYRVTGALTLDQATYKVTGQAWLDREWSSQPLAAEQEGWDWFSLSFDNGAKLMGFRLRSATGVYSSGTWVDRHGATTQLANGAFQANPEPDSGQTAPTRWRLRVPGQELDITVKALNPNAWMDTSFPYWEGPVVANGSHEGRGYLEMTGYPPPVSQ